MKYILIALGMCSIILIASPQGFPVHTNTVISGTSTVLLATNKDRGYLLVQNNGAVDCQMKFGSPITSDNDGVVISSGQNYEAINAYIKSSVYMKCASGASIAAVEANY
jgi:hypothetical protein